MIKKKPNGKNAEGYPNHGLTSRIICFDELCRNKASWKQKQKSMSYKARHNHNQKIKPPITPPTKDTTTKNNSIAFKKMEISETNSAPPTQSETIKDEYIDMVKPCTKKIFTFNNLNFEIGTSVISYVSMSSLDSIVTILKENPTLKIHIMGHTDHIGTENGNLKLSLDRANAVSKILENAGITKDRITTSGFGSTKPLTTSITEEDRKKNRRVEFKFKEG